MFSWLKRKTQKNLKRDLSKADSKQDGRRPKRMTAPKSESMADIERIELMLRSVGKQLREIKRLPTLSQKHNENDNTSLRMLLDELIMIKIMINDNVDKVSEKTIQGIKAELENLQMNTLKAKTPMALASVSKGVMKSVNKRLDMLVDFGLMKLIKTHGRLSSLELVRLAKEKEICGQASVYRHLSHLVDNDKVGKKRAGKIVYYYVPDQMSIKETKEEDAIS